MAINANTLAALIKAQILATPPASQTLDTFSLAIATAVVTHLTAAAVVIPGTFVAPPGTAGGPITGTGKVT